ncbi:MAG: DNA repair protein RadC [Crocinitomicaceae bacterium]|nr:DNA repair protein RadC [Flavobacteriales bacterium]NQZ35260.1 DNA repair protein RadC [Crocinitomicaceae bacterium]
MSTTIKSMPVSERPREKLLNKGRDFISNTELIALLIGSGTRNQSAIEIASIILKDSNNDLQELAKKSISDLKKFKGIGDAKAILIYSALELGRRKPLSEAAKYTRLTCSRHCYEFLYPYFADLTHEEFYAVYVNRNNKIMAVRQISKGGLSGTVADGKVIFQKALEARATGIVIAHNHPSGVADPSPADMHLTKSLHKFGMMIDLQILDHLIITDNNYFSFADEGLLG